MTSPNFTGSGGFQYVDGAGGGSFPQQSVDGADPSYQWWKKSSDGMVPGTESRVGEAPSPWGQDHDIQHGGSIDVQSMSKSQMMQALLINSVNNPDQLITFQQQLVRAGLLNPRSKKFLSGDMYQGDATWLAADALFDKAIQTGTDYKTLLEKQAKAGGKTGTASWNYYLKMFGHDGLGANGDGSANIDTTNTNVSTNVSTKMDAQGLLMTSLQRELGRDPSKAELNAFTNALQAYERANPNVTTAHTTGSGSGDTHTSTTTTGGANPEVFAENYAMQPGNQDEVTSLRGRGFVDQFERMMRGG